MERECVNAKHWDGKRKNNDREEKMCVHMCMYVPVCVCMHAVKEAELLYITLRVPHCHFFKMQLRQMMEDGKYKGASESIACGETEREKQRMNG